MRTAGWPLKSARLRSFRAASGRLAAAAFAAAVPLLNANAQVVSQPHVTAELVSEMDSIPAAGKWSMAVRFETEPGWHIYWKNSGDAGNPTSVRWTPPAGGTVGPVLWPYPKRFDLRPLAVYGYEGPVMLPVELEAPMGLAPGQLVTIRVKAKWVVCEKICLAGTAELERKLPVGSAGGTPDPRSAEAFAEARRRLPRVLDEWDVSAARTATGFAMRVAPPAGWTRPIDELEFFADSNVVVNHAARQRATTTAGVTTLELARSSYATKPVARLRGVLVSRGGWDADGTIHGLAVDVPVTDVSVTDTAMTKPAAAIGPSPRARRALSPVPADVADTATGADTVAVVAAGTDTVAAAGTGVTHSVADTTVPELGAAIGDESMGSPAGTDPGLFLALAFAALGGLLLNLMPCVFPVISLKILSFSALAGGRRTGVVRHGLAFAAGVVVSFWTLAALLLALRRTGAELGWGFQLQSPPFVAGMALLFFLLALSLLGVFEIGLPLTRLGGAAAGATSPHLSASFSTGILAAVVATPCTAPFMGPAIGAALTQSAAYALLVFTALGVGMALPYVVLAAWPHLLDRLPRPGVWMLLFKQALAFPMFATVAWLIWVLGVQVGVNGVFRLLLAFTIAGAGAWVLGQWGTATVSSRSRYIARSLAVGMLLGAVGLGLRHAAPAPAPRLATAPATAPISEDSTAISWEPFSPARLEALRRAGRPVFIDFTAAWCLSCKVNERVALDDAGVRRRLRALDVATLRADWTSSDATITRALAAFGRQGVPLYVLYVPRRSQPIVLPTFLTPGTMLEALTEVLAPRVSTCSSSTNLNVQGGHRCNLLPLSRS